MQLDTDTHSFLRPQSFMVTFRATVFAAVLMGLFATVGATQPVGGTPNTVTPVFRVRILGDTATGFSTRIDSYFELRGQLQRTLPAVVVTDDVRQIRQRIRSLAKAIRVARRGATRGEFFTVATTVEFKQTLALIMNADVWAVIMDDNPGAFRHDIDGSYPEGKPRSTMPALVLAHLPDLPDGIEYRFIGRHLILYDAKANTIIDRLPNAISCKGCDD